MPQAATLIIRIGAMGDIIHTLPAVASLKASQPERPLLWLVAEKWLPLLAGNPSVDNTLIFDRSSWQAIRETYQRVKQARIETAIDFQGLIKSALSGWLARPQRFFGFDRAHVRERPASWFYTDRVPANGPHRVERALQLARAAGATEIVSDGWIPPGSIEGDLPGGPFVLTTPFAGWVGKEWPLAFLDALGRELRREGIDLVANVPDSRSNELADLQNVRLHRSSLSGLIGAMRLASAVVAPDSGPLHLAAALRKPGVALFGPTDPAANGPFGGTITVLRASDAETTYKRHRQVHSSMHKVTVEQVTAALMASLSRQESSIR